MGTTGAVLGWPSAFAATPVVPATHLLTANVSSQISPCPHLPSHAWRSHSPVLVLQTVPAVQIATQPPAARFAAAAPRPAAVVTAAPTSVFGEPVLHPRNSSATSRRPARALTMAEPSRPV